MSTDTEAPVVEQPVEQPVAVEEPEVVTPPEAPEEPQLTLVTGKALDVWQDAASTFVPALKKDLTPEQRREAVREVASQARHADDRLKLVLGELLYEAAANGYYKEWINPETEKPFETFEEYVEGELNIKKSTAHYLKKIYKVFVVELDLPTEVLRDLEWSKAAELTKVINAENADELLSKIGSMSVKEVKDLVRAMQGKTPTTASVSKEKDDDKVNITFKCSPEQAENVKAALELAESMTGSEVPANNIDLICTDFIAGAAGGGLQGAFSRLDVAVQSLERAFGVKLEVKDHDKERYEKLKEKQSEDKE